MKLKGLSSVKYRTKSLV
ncbi:hypothetical protein FOC71_07795 [Streptococcus intermedius]|uniref:Uncharacterized protein n=1 Tax=Streptococcus intermedius TaxID=1338 RepID=A0A930RD07_STRIT|nr:hypothetical protein [Streptococcus intermedius]QKH78792.1 hypothetical protein FOC71_07795 [Streptococcus intermedius]